MAPRLGAALASLRSTRTTSAWRPAGPRASCRLGARLMRPAGGRAAGAQPPGPGRDLGTVHCGSPTRAALRTGHVLSRRGRPPRAGRTPCAARRSLPVGGWSCPWRPDAPPGRASRSRWVSGDEALATVPGSTRPQNTASQYRLPIVLLRGTHWHPIVSLCFFFRDKIRLSARWANCRR